VEGFSRTRRESAWQKKKGRVVLEDFVAKGGEVPKSRTTSFKGGEKKGVSSTKEKLLNLWGRTTKTQSVEP